MQNSFGHRRQRGISLVEIMVALFIGLFLTAGILELFMGTRQTYRFEEALSRIQENGRYALEAIARDARMAGFGGCADFASMEPADPAARADLIQIEAGEVAAAIAGTDQITLRRLEGVGASISEQTDATAITLAANPDGFQAGQRLAVVDCTNRWIEIFAAAHVSNSPVVVTLNEDDALSRTYPAPPAALTDPLVAQVFRYRAVTYFIRAGANGSPALWRQVEPAAPEELVPGVEDMEVTYLVGGGYVGAGENPNWQNVRGIRISLLLASLEDNLTEQPQVLPWRGGEVPDPPDNRLRQVFTTTVALRNQLP